MTPYTYRELYLVIRTRPHLALLTIMLVVALALLSLPAMQAIASADELVIVVDGAASNASDENGGTAAAPLRTIQAGVARAEQANAEHRPARVLVHPHTYRESVQMHKQRQRTDAPVTIEGAAPGVVLSGSDVFTNWRVDGRTLVHDWTQRWGTSPIPNGWHDYLSRREISSLLRRREVVFADGVPLRQAGSSAELLAAPGRFVVDEDAGTLRVHPPPGAAQPRLEVGVRERVLQVSGWRNVTIRNLSVVHTPSPIQGSAVLIDSSENILLEDLDIRWSSWAGLGITWSTDVVVRGSNLDDNGIMGLTTYQSNRLTVERSSTSRNNWRGDWYGFDNWENSAKIWSVRGMVLREHTAVDNLSYGFWYDWDNVDVRVERSFFARNKRAGLFVEASQGPFTIEGNVICDNGKVGLEDGRSENVTLIDNQIFNNEEAQIRFTGHWGGRRISVRDGEARVLETRNWTLRDNVIVGGGDSQPVFLTTLPAQDWSTVAGTLRSDRNRWHSSSTSSAFRLPDGVRTDLAGWRTATGQDATSSGDLPGTPLTCLPPFSPSSDVLLPGSWLLEIGTALVIERD
jgi:parallel beta-helix repeat protein